MTVPVRGKRLYSVEDIIQRVFDHEMAQTYIFYKINYHEFINENNSRHVLQVAYFFGKLIKFSICKLVIPLNFII